MIEPVGRLRFTLACAALAVGGCTCDEPISRLRAAIEVDPPQVDFGRVALGGSKEVPLEVKNIGSFALTIEEFRWEAPFRGPTGTATIATGGTIEIMVSFAPTELGVAQGTLTLTPDDPTAAPVEVPLMGEGIEAAVRVEPLVIDFGEVLLTSMTQEETRMVTVSNPGTDSFQLTALELPEDGAGAFSLDMMQAVGTYGPMESKMFAVSFLPNAMGPVTGRVRIATTAPEGEEIFVSLMGRAVGPIFEICAGGPGLPDACTANGGTPRIDFAIERNASATGYIQLLNTGDRDLTFGGSLTAVEPEIAVTPDPMSIGQGTIAPGGEQRFDVQYTPEDYLFDNLLVAFGSNAYNRPGQAVRIDGRVLKPLINVDPDMITVTQDGNVPEARVTVEVRNCGEAPLVLNSVVLQETGGNGPSLNLYSAPAPGTTIQPMPNCANDPATTMFEVGFDPPGNGFYDGVVTIDSNDPLTPMTTVSVSGTRR
jgi:hypothetical protein